jgi:hypothetical protein
VIKAAISAEKISSPHKTPKKAFYYLSKVYLSVGLCCLFVCSGKSLLQLSDGCHHITGDRIANLNL